MDKILNKYNYYKADVPDDGELSEADIVELYKTYGENKAFKMHLKDLCENDKNLYFLAVDDRERDMIRGATQRTKYFLSLINKSNDTGNQKRDTKNQTKDTVLSGKINRIADLKFPKK